MEHKRIVFHAEDENGNPVEHTNVLLCIGEGFAIVCLESLKNAHERKLVVDSLTENGNSRIEISLSQMHNFCANALALQNNKGEQVFVISLRGWKALNNKQQEQIRLFCSQIITPELNVIETCGGGRSEEHTSELQSLTNLVCRLLLEKKKQKDSNTHVS